MNLFNQNTRLRLCLIFTDENRKDTFIQNK